MLKPETIILSFSGGLTSAYMVKFLLEKYSHLYNFVVTFANTGKENEATLKFVDNCDKYYAFNTVWLEAVVNPVYGKGVRHRIVTFETASRNGEPFEAQLKKFGISNGAAPHCTRDLKTRVIRSYLRSVGLRKCRIAIGIRADEADRINENFRKERIIYPLINSKGWPCLGNVRKPQIREFWEGNIFTLGLPEEDGNCDGCFKKSIAKLVSIARRRPEVFDWWDRMETTYGMFRPPSLPRPERPDHFYRHNLSAKQILQLSKLPDDEIKRVLKEDDLTLALNGCSESCEAF